MSLTEASKVIDRVCERCGKRYELYSLDEYDCGLCEECETDEADYLYDRLDIWDEY